MLTKSGVKLLDFGLAKAIAPASQQSSLTAFPTQHAPHAGRDDPRDVPVHGAGAARRQGSRRAHRHLRVRLRALRDGHGEEGVLGGDAGVADLVDLAGRAAADLAGPADVASSARPRRQEVSRERSGGSLAERGGPRRRAQVDCGGRLPDLCRGRRPSPAKEARLDRVGRSCPSARSPLSRKRSAAAQDRRPCHGRSLLHRSSREDGVPVHRRRLGSDRDFAGRHARSLRCRRKALGSVARDWHSRAAQRNGRRAVSVLVPGRSLDRVLLGRKAENPGSFGRSRADDLRCSEPPRRRMGKERRHRLRAGHQHGSLPSRGVRRHPLAPHHANGPKEAHDQSLALLPPGWKARPVSRGEPCQPEVRGERDLCCLSRRRRIAAAHVVLRQRPVRVRRTPLGARYEPDGNSFRSQANHRHRPGGAHRRRRELRHWSLARHVHCLGERRARIPDRARGWGRAADVGRFFRPDARDDR